MSSGRYTPSRFVESSLEFTPQERRAAKKRVREALDELGVVNDLSDASRRFVIDRVFSLGGIETAQFLNCSIVS